MDLTPLNVAFAILGISFLVIVHEAGHYLAARAFGMRVLRFSIGLGPPLWKYQAKGSPTVFQVCAIPLLAYVQIDGMNPTEQVDPEDSGLYPNKGVFARIVTIFAGPFANYLAAAVMVFVLSLVGGLPNREMIGANQIGWIEDGTPAADAGLQEMDRIVEANGKPVTSIKHVSGISQGRGGQPTEYVIERDGERFSVTITPEQNEEAGYAVIGVGLHARRTYKTFTVAEAARNAVKYPWLVTVRTFEGIASLIRRRTTEGVTSVVGMAKIMADSIKIGWQEYVSRLIMLSVALGLFNLLPFPALDGGRLAFLGYELITRRRANERIEAAVHTVGLLFLLGVLVLVMIRDVMHPPG